MMTFLASFITRSFHLNATASPHKLILIYLEQQTKESQIARALAERICKELNEAYLNAQQTDKIIESPQVPHTVKITERTLFDGVILLQHFKPRIDEEVHVSQLKDKLLMAKN
jgi:hypothetical protein